MHPKYFGDSYDLVKHCLLRWLSPLGNWTTHPLFTTQVTRRQAAAFSELLGTPLLSVAELKSTTDRQDYFDAARSCPSHLFLDPDTGLRLASTSARKAPAYVFLHEMVSIAKRGRTLTLVYDQCLPRGGEARALVGKLDALYSHGVHAIGYRSHACFLLASPSAQLLRNARQLLIEVAHLPRERLLTRSAA
jgi:hypothetical protein